MGFIDIVSYKPHVIAAEQQVGNKVKILLTGKEQPPQGYEGIYRCTIAEKARYPFLLDAKELVDAEEQKQVMFIRLLKQKKPFGLMNLEWSKKKDFLHHRRSGLNHIILQAMKEENIAYVITYEHFSQQTIPQEIMLGRIMQNIILARKAKVRVLYASLASWPEEVKAEKDVLGMLQLLGMNSQQLKAAFLR